MNLVADAPTMHHARKVDLVLVIVAAIALAFATFRVATSPAAASHLTWDVRHLGTMHSAYIDEDLCVESSNTTQSWSTAQTNISNALWIDNPSADQKWDAKGWDPNANGGHYKVWFWAHWENPCQLINPTFRSIITIEYWLHDDNTSTCGARTASCAIGSQLFADDLGHNSYRYYYIHLYAPYTTGAQLPGYYHHQVNHESGHALGFADGDGTCPDSVMHSTAYGCGTDRYYPSAGDTTNENTRILN